MRDGARIVHDMAVYFYLGALAILGRITVATTVQMITAASTFTNSLQTIITCYQDMLKKVNYANEYVKFMEYPIFVPFGTVMILTGCDISVWAGTNFNSSFIPPLP